MGQHMSLKCLEQIHQTFDKKLIRWLSILMTTYYNYLSILWNKDKKNCYINDYLF